MEDKPKNKSKTDAKGLSCLKGFAIGIVVTFMIPVVFAGLVVLQTLWIEWRKAQFIEYEPPFVQAAIREQCLVSDDMADGYFDDSSGYPPPYIYRLEDSESWFRCYKYGEFWQCSCDELD